MQFRFFTPTHNHIIDIDLSNKLDSVFNITIYINKMITYVIILQFKFTTYRK